MRYNTYLFDFDYTLANSEKGIVSCFQHVLNKNNFYNIKDDDIKRTIGYTLEESFSKLTGIKDSIILEEYKHQYIEKANEIMTKNTTLFPEAIQTLTKLKEDGNNIGIISTKLSIRIKETLKQYNITDIVDIIIGGDDVKSPKPNNEGIIAAIERLNVLKEDVLYIGDSLVDIYTAKNANVDFIGVTTGTTKKEEFIGLPYIKIIESLNELINP